MADVTSNLPGTPVPCVPVEAAGEARKRHVALVPGEAVPLIRLDLPERLRGAAREQVARRQLVDMLGPEAEALHVLPFARAQAPDAWDRVLVAARGQIAAWKAQTGKRCAALLPDYLALPTAEGVWCVAAGSDGGMRARFGPDDGASGPEAVVGLMADRLIAEGDTPERVLRYGPGLPLFEARLAAAGLEVEPVGAESTDLPESFGHGELALDLRADPHAARTRLTRGLRAWGLPLAASVIAASLWGGAQLVALRALEAEIADVQSGTLREVRAVFVPEGPVLDLRIQVARALAAQRAALTVQSEGTAAFDLFAGAAQVLADEQARLDRVSGTADGRLRLLLGLADFSAVDRMVDALAEAGMIVSVEDARLADASAEGGRVLADLILTADGAEGQGG